MTAPTDTAALLAWLRAEQSRLERERDAQFEIRRRNIANGKQDTSTWPEFHDGQREGMRQVQLAIASNRFALSPPWDDSAPARIEAAEKLLEGLGDAE